MSLIRGRSPSWLATVAHELRGPLTALESASELLDRDLEQLDRSEIRAMVSGIHRRTLWMRGLMENLLCNAAINEGRFTIRSRPTDVVVLAQDIAAMMRPLLERKKQDLRVTAHGPVIAHADAHRLSQVFLNLLFNAHKYSAAETTIDVEIASDDRSARVSVSDRGPGLRDELRQRAFRAYDRAGRTDGDGLGLGLWVVGSIVRAHGGQVGVTNRDGGGAVFWFELPLAAAVPLDEFARAV